MAKLCEVTQIDGKWALVFEYKEGKTMEELMQEHPEKFEEYMKQVQHFRQKCTRNLPRF